MRAHIRAVEGVVKGILGRASGSTVAERRGRGVVRWTVRLAGPRGKRRVARMTRGMRRSVMIGAGADPTPCANVLLMMKRMHLNGKDDYACHMKRRINHSTCFLI